MSERLGVTLNGRRVGEMRPTGDETIGLSYDPDWYLDWVRGEAHAISLSLPVSDPAVTLDATAYVAGLLPDNPQHREILARELEIGDAPSDFELISRIGGESAGALMITPRDGLHHEGNAAPSAEWLSESQLAEHLRSLPRRPLLVDDDHGVMLSLAGVNDKAAVILNKGRVGLPINGAASTHIIKIDIPGLEGSVTTEHFCLRVAKAAGMRVPHSRLHRAEGLNFMLMARYDRMTGPGGETIRAHQEDLCQALGVMPSRKYQRHGGPGWSDCFRVADLMSDPTSAREEMTRWAVLQFLIGNPDAHAKNYSVLYSSSGKVGLAPVYDLNNGPAFWANFRKVRPMMAMSIGGQSVPGDVTLQDWRDFAESVGVSPRLVERTIIETAHLILAGLPKAVSECFPCDALRLAEEDIRARCEKWANTPSPRDLSFP